MTTFSISGTLSPDCTTENTGEVAGQQNGEDYWTWTNDAGTWYLYSNTRWRIANIMRPIGQGDFGDVFWLRDTVPKGSPEPVPPQAYTYSPSQNATGTATVVEVVSDDTPDAFSFTAETDTDPSTQYTSDSQEITGMDEGTSISVSGDGSPEYRINGGSWTSEAGTIDPADTLELRATSSSETGAPRSGRVATVTITVGSSSVDWTITNAFVSQTFALKSVEVDGGTFVVRTTDIED